VECSARRSLDGGPRRERRDLSRTKGLQMAERAAIVTGASSGIGLAIARVLAEEGHGVTMAARRPEKLDGAVAGLEADGFDVHGVAANVADESEIEKVVAAHRERYGRLDVLVNNAGVGIGSTVGEIETKRLDMQLDINIRSIVLFYRECVSMLLEAGAQHKNALVVNTSSISGKRAEGWLAVYSATKHAVVGWTEAMNKELGTQGVKSTALCPAFVDTPMTDFVKGQVAAEEMIRPQDIAESVRYLLRTSPACVVPEIMFIRPGDSL
jgi:NAD(P)-dependent dehydrogenase (short-subunit alcohol dehydrogenase family)